MSKQKTVVNLLLVYILMFTSGAMLFKLSSEKFLIAALFVSLIAWTFYSDRKVNPGFVLYVTVFTGFLLIIHLYTDGSLSVGSVLGTTLKLIIAYIIMKTVGKDFPHTYVNVIVFLAAFSLFGYLSDQLNLFNGLIRMLPPVGDTGYGGIFYVFRYHYQGYGRNNSIFFEPGAYQIFVNVGLFILLFVQLELRSSKRWFYTLLLLVTLLTTYSTTGFMIFAIMFGLFLFNSRMLSTTSKVVLLGIILMMVFVFSAQFKSVIIEKIATYMSVEDITDSGDRRGFDLLVDLEIIKENLLGLGHRKYSEIFSATGLVREGSSSSNGVTKLLAVYGLPFSLLYFGSFYWAFRRLLGKLGAFMGILPMMMYLIFLVGESYFLFVPFTMAVIAATFVFNRNQQEDMRGREKEFV